MVRITRNVNQRFGDSIRGCGNLLSNKVLHSYTPPLEITLCSDPIATIAAAVDSILSTKQLAQTTIRNVLGTRSLSDIMASREEIALQAQEILGPTAARWGIKLERVEVKDIRLPRQLTRVLAIEAEASREADAKIVKAAGELNVSIFLSTLN